MSGDELSCPSTFSPGRALVMTTSLGRAVGALQEEIEDLGQSQPASHRTVEALLVQLEQVLERVQAGGGDISASSVAAESSRHALSSGDVSLAVAALQDAVLAVLA